MPCQLIQKMRESKSGPGVGPFDLAVAVLELLWLPSRVPEVLLRYIVVGELLTVFAELSFYCI